MAEKKNEVITFRTEDWIKEELAKIAKYNQWSIAQTVNQICINYLINPQPGKITIKAEDFVKAAIDVRQEGMQKGVEIEIKIRDNEEKQIYEKFLHYTIIESGGLGAIDDFDMIKGLTEDEIFDIP